MSTSDTRVLREGSRVLTFETARDVELFIVQKIEPFFEKFSRNHPAVEYSSAVYHCNRGILLGKFFELQGMGWGIISFDEISKGILDIHVEYEKYDRWDLIKTISTCSKWLWEVLYNNAKEEAIVTGHHNIVIHPNDALTEEIRQCKITANKEYGRVLQTYPDSDEVVIGHVDAFDMAQGIRMGSLFGSGDHTNESSHNEARQSKHTIDKGELLARVQQLEETVCKLQKKVFALDDIMVAVD